MFQTKWMMNTGLLLEDEIIPGSSKCVKFVPFHLQKPTKRQQFYISGRSRYEIQQLYLGSLDHFDFLFAPLVVGGWLDLSEVVVGPKAVVEKAVELGPGGEIFSGNQIAPWVEKEKKVERVEFLQDHPMTWIRG